MALNTFSKFYYIDSVDSTNQNLNFDEGGGELLATINIGSFTLTNLMAEIKTALDAAGGQEYTVSFDRSTRLVTISATSNFDLLISSGSQTTTGPWTLIGFTGGSDLTGTNSYTGDTAIGTSYAPQFKLQDYIDPNKHQERIDPAINESASGVIEVVSFGIRQRIEMNIMWITDIAQDGYSIKSNSNGVSDAQDFMQFITTRSPLEFMPDEETESTFFSVQLEKTQSNSKGVGYILKEETSKNLPGYYSTGKLTFRVV